MSEQIREKVQDILRMVMGDNDIQAVDELSAKDVDNWDSMNHVNFIVTIESEFSFRFSNEAITEIENIGQLVALIEAQQAK